MDKLVSGFYVLDADVPNPTPDRRKRDDWRYLPVWPAGSTWLVRTYRQEGAVVGMDGPYWASKTVPEWRAAALGLLSHLVLRPAATVREALEVADLEDWLNEALDRMVREGRITAADVVAAAQAERDEHEQREEDGR